MNEPPTDPRAPWPSTPDVHDVDDVNLLASLADLAGLVSGTFSLGELLGRVATFAVHAIPGADGAGVTLLRAGPEVHRVEALAASDPFVADIDELQYTTLQEGPCITAALERRTVRSGSLGGERLWPRFGPRVGRLGVHSVLSLPLLLPNEVVGAINVYARKKDVFDDHAASMGEHFAAPAAVAVHNAQVLAQAVALTAQLQTALGSRPVIDQAIGILRSRSGESADQAFARLRVISQRENRKLADIARQVVDEATRRARVLAVAVVDHPKAPGQKPDNGIWEGRGPRRHFVSSKVMAWVGTDGAVTAVERCGLTGPAGRWRRVRREIHEDVCRGGLDTRRGAFTQFSGPAGLDAVLLKPPRLGFLSSRDPRAVATVRAIGRELSVDGLSLRYDPDLDGGVDAPTGAEGTLLACSFWMVEARCARRIGRRGTAAVRAPADAAQRRRPPRGGVRHPRTPPARQPPAGLQPRRTDQRGAPPDRCGADR